MWREPRGGLRASWERVGCGVIGGAFGVSSAVVSTTVDLCRDTTESQGLKGVVNAVLRKVELEQAMGLAEFLRNSRITLDTTGVRNLSVGSRLLWGQLIDD